jgi:hypothetical protein
VLFPLLGPGSRADTVCGMSGFGEYFDCMSARVNSPASTPPARRATMVEAALARKPRSPRESGTYALFMFQDHFLGTVTAAQCVTSRKEKRLIIPPRTFGFFFVDVESAYGGWVRPSHMYYLDGEVRTRETLHLFLGGYQAGQILDCFPNAERFFRPATGGLFPMEPDDVALPVERTVSL